MLKCLSNLADHLNEVMVNVAQFKYGSAFFLALRVATG
jgi:hypothetical protein